jgi:hypothetical protein
MINYSRSYAKNDLKDQKMKQVSGALWKLLVTKASREGNFNQFLYQNFSLIVYLFKPFPFQLKIMFRGLLD